MMLPMVVLYEGSILLASLLDRRAARARAREQADRASAELSHLDTETD
jgi:Sec-independent protein secretion pathway component TatC